MRDLHPGVETWRGKGLFTVTHGSNFLSRMLARLLNLPRAGDSVPLRLTVMSGDGRETWRREFAGRPFITHQRASHERGGFLVEEFGPTEVWYRLEAADGALVYRQAKSVLRLNGWRLPFPGPLFPSIAARESADPNGRGTLVHVRVTLPLLGLLLAYAGHVEREKEAGA